MKKPKNSRWILILLLVSAIVIAFAPLILSRSFGLVSFDNTGQIGDTIGGITAPFTSLLGSLLVYFALKTQIDANRIIYAQFEHQKEEENTRKLNLYLLEQVKIFRDDLNNLTYDSTKRQGTGDKQKVEKIHGKGSRAVSLTLGLCAKTNQNHLDDDIYVVLPNLRLIKSFLERVEYLMDKIATEPIDSKDKEYLSSLVEFTYKSNLQPFLLKYEVSRMSKSPPCKNCGKKHDGIPEDLYEIYDRLNEKCFPLEQSEN